MSKKLANYIKAQLQKGYDIPSIKQVTLKYGYSAEEIDAAIKDIYNPTLRHEIHLGATTVFVIVLLVLALGAGAYFFLQPGGKPAKLLDLSLEPISGSAAPGENFAFIKEIKNLGSSQRYDVEITYELISQKTLKTVSSKTETVAVETSTSAQTRFAMPQDAPAGDYTLRAVAQYDGKRAVATIPVRITKPAEAKEKETCFDGIKNQDEEDTDCGGICLGCQDETVPVSCNDNDACTQDTVKEGQCTFEKIQPCCGDGICEAKEECGLDCKAEIEGEQMPSIEELKQLAKTDPAKTQQYCGMFEVPDLKDTCISNLGEAQSNKNYCGMIANARLKDVCYMNLAKKLKDNAICGDITTDGRKDSCYMTFVTDYKDYSVCPRITNDALRRSCEYLRQIYTINQNNQNPPSSPVPQAQEQDNVSE